MDQIKTIKIKLPIEGMTCANCSARIERTLNKTEGIIDAKVDLASEIAHILLDSKKINSDEIKKKIENIGYTVPNSRLESDEKMIEERQRYELKKQKNKFYISIILTIPVMILGMNWIYTPATYTENIILNSLLAFASSIILFYSGSQF